MPNRLKELRMAHHITQKDIAELLDITPSAVSFWESGKNRIDWRAATILAKRFKVTPEYLLGETDEIEAPLPSQSDRVLIPVLGYIRAGTPITGRDKRVAGKDRRVCRAARKGRFDGT